MFWILPTLLPHKKVHTVRLTHSGGAYCQTVWGKLSQYEFDECQTVIFNTTDNIKQWIVSLICMHVEFLHLVNMSLGLFWKEMYWCAAFQYAICCSLSFCVLNITYLALFLEGKCWKVLKCDLQTGQPLSEALSAGERKRLPSFMRRVWEQEEKWPIRGQEEPVPEQVSPVWGSLKLLCVCLCAVSRTYLSRKTLLILKKIG